MTLAVTAGPIPEGAPLLNSCTSLARRNPAASAGSTSSQPQLDEVSRIILSYASLAPSGHNSQPWAVRVEASDVWVVEADHTRSLPVVDPDNRELLLSIGAFVENLTLAAGALGLAAETQVIARNRQDPDVVRVRLRKDLSRDIALQELEKRRTVKNGLLPRELAARDVRVLTERTGGRLDYFPRGSARASALRDAAVQAGRTQVMRDDAQQELTSWLRFSSRDAGRCRDGLTPQGMEIGALKGWFLRHFVKPGDFMKSSFRRQSGDVLARQAGEGGGWFVLSSPGQTVGELIESGRSFQRMALQARDLGIGIHPMSQVLEEQGRSLLCFCDLPQDHCPQFVLRAGYLENYPAPVTLRRPVSWFVHA